MKRRSLTWLPVVLSAFICTITATAQDHSVLVYGLVPNAPPTTYIGNDGEPTGFFVELFSRIMDELGIRYVYKVDEFSALYRDMLAGKVDFFTALSRTPERETLFVFPEESAFAGWSQLFIAPGTSIESIYDLNHKKIGVIRDDRNGLNFREYAQSLGIPFEMVEFDGFDKLVSAVLDGSVFGGVQSNMFVATEPRIQPTAIVFAPFRSYPVLSRASAFASEFRRIMQRYSQLVEDPDSYYYELQTDWLGTERSERTVVPVWVKAGVLALILATLASLVIIRMLTGRLRRANQELERKVADRTELLVRTEKMATLGTMVAGIAHEFNTPLQTLLASADVLQADALCGHLEPQARERLLLLLERKHGPGPALHADSATARRMTAESLSRMDSLDRDDIDRLAPLLARLGILEPDDSVVRMLAGADGQFIEAAQDAADKLDAIEAAREAVSRMSDIIQALRIYTHRDASRQVSIISLGRQLDSVLTLFADRCTEAGILVMARYSSVPEYRCQAEQLQQVWMHLVSNAVEVMPEGGTLTITGIVSGDAVEVTVSDTGPGIPADVQARMFEPFFTTRHDALATGLGLSIASEIVKNHRGTLSYTTGSTGSSFIVRLPRAGIVDEAAPPELPEV